jgi:hypothetical protein
LKQANSINVKVGAGNQTGKTSNPTANCLASLQIFSTRDPEKVKQLEESLAVPKFSAPWTSEDSSIKLVLQEELPMNHVVLCMPALNQLDGSVVIDVELSGEDKNYFHFNAINGDV